MAAAHDELGKWLKSREINELRETNLTTARTSMDTLWAFLASVLDSYGAEISRRGLPSAEFSVELQKSAVKAKIVAPAKKQSRKRSAIEENIAETRGGHDDIPTSPLSVASARADERRKQKKH